MTEYVAPVPGASDDGHSVDIDDLTRYLTDLKKQGVCLPAILDLESRVATLRQARGHYRPREGKKKVTDECGQWTRWPVANAATVACRAPSWHDHVFKDWRGIGVETPAPNVSVIHDFFFNTTSRWLAVILQNI